MVLALHANGCQHQAPIAANRRRGVESALYGCDLDPPLPASLEAKDKKLPKGVILARADTTQKERGWELQILKTKLTFTMANEAPNNAITVETIENRRWAWAAGTMLP